MGCSHLAVVDPAALRSTTLHKTKLVTLGRHLEELGYEIVGLLTSNPEDEDQKTLFLRADRVEVHSVDSLHERNAQLGDIALCYGQAFGAEYVRHYLLHHPAPPPRQGVLL